MAMSLIANIANVIGNIILVLILGQGVAGAAISTLAARALCALLVLLRLVKPRENQPVYVANYTRIRPPHAFDPADSPYRYSRRH